MSHKNVPVIIWDYYSPEKDVEATKPVTFFRWIESSL
jgi:hypothetical protein